MHAAKKYHLVFLRSVRRLLVAASVFPSSPILVTLMMEALSYSQTSVLARATRRNIPEDAVVASVPFDIAVWPQNGVTLRTGRFLNLARRISLKTKQRRSTRVNTPSGT
jgi:hypothetical protein